MRILIVRLSALGDSALTIPLLLALREALPEAHIGWVVEELSASLLQTLPQIDTLHVWRKQDKNFSGAWRMGREIKAQQYDVSLDAQGLTKSAILPWLAGIKKRIGFARAPLEAREIAPLLNNILVRPEAALKHIADRTLALGEGLGLDLARIERPPLPIDPAALETMQAWWQENGLGEKTMIFGIGTSWVTKIWPVEYMAKIVERAQARGYRCVITWGPSEEAQLPAWREMLGESVLFSPRTKHIGELVALLSLGERYAGPDSAPLHLAWLLGKPTLSWFGPSDSERGGPYGPGQVRIVAHPPTREREGPMLYALKPEVVIPQFEAWCDSVEVGM